jgi:DNA ligase-1
LDLVARRGARHRALSRDRLGGGALPDGTVLDGEIVAWKDERVAPFALLQQRIGRKR